DDASKADFKQSIGWDDDIIFIDAEHFDQVYSQHIEKGQTSNEVQIDNEVDASIEQPKNRLDIQDEDYVQSAENYFKDKIEEPFNFLGFNDIGGNEQMPTDGNTDEVEVEGDINSIDDDSTPKFNPSTDMANPRFRLLMEFSNIKILKEAVRQYSIKNSRQI
ncbi:hypothetical protein PanWU01x14_287990, partial [Parasponia andersonii]